MIFTIVKIIILAIILNYSINILTNKLDLLGIYFKVSYFAVGIVFMAVATSMPELFIGIESAIKNVPELSFGNVIGANIANISLVLGIAILFASKKFHPSKDVYKKDSIIAIFIALLPIILSLDKIISKIDGIIMLLVFIIYIYYIFLSKQKITETFKKTAKITIFKDIFIVLICIFTLLFSTNYLVIYAKEITLRLNFPIVLIGVSFFALSTTLPELVFSIKSVKKGNNAIVFGNLLGSVIANSTLILGITAIISPISISNFSVYICPLIFLLIVLYYYFFRFIKNTDYIYKIEGVLLITIYIVFLLFEFGIVNFFN